MVLFQSSDFASLLGIYTYSKMTRKENNNENKILSCLESSGRIQFQENSIFFSPISLPCLFRPWRKGLEIPRIPLMYEISGSYPLAWGREEEAIQHNDPVHMNMQWVKPPCFEWGSKLSLSGRQLLLTLIGHVLCARVVPAHMYACLHSGPKGSWRVQSLKRIWLCSLWEEPGIKKVYFKRLTVFSK